MATGQIAGEVDVTCNYDRRRWGALLLATTTQFGAEGAPSRGPGSPGSGAVGSGRWSAPNYLSPRLNGLLCGPRTDSIIG